MAELGRFCWDPLGARQARTHPALCTVPQHTRKRAGCAGLGRLKGRVRDSGSGGREAWLNCGKKTGFGDKNLVLLNSVHIDAAQPLFPHTPDALVRAVGGS